MWFEDAANMTWEEEDALAEGVCVRKSEEVRVCLCVFVFSLITLLGDILIHNLLFFG